jgi:hypothetical protein
VKITLLLFQWVFFPNLGLGQGPFQLGKIATKQENWEYPHYFVQSEFFLQVGVHGELRRLLINSPKEI